MKITLYTPHGAETYTGCEVLAGDGIRINFLGTDDMGRRVKKSSTVPWTVDMTAESVLNELDGILKERVPLDTRPV